MSDTLVEKYGEIESIKNRFLKRTANLSSEQLNKQSVDGGWSAGQVLYHTAYAESGTILVIRKNLEEQKVNIPSDISGVLRNILLVILLKLPLKFKAPKAVSKVPDAITFDELKDYFDRNSAAFKQILLDLPAELEDKYIFKHPRGGLFNIQQTLNFTREHYLHHERQLNALL
ncbi:MAG: DinB family protein [Chitinophagales bacterium]